MTETLFTRKPSYLAKADDITGMCADETQPTFYGRLRQSLARKPGGRGGLWWVWGARLVITRQLLDPDTDSPVPTLSLDLPCGQVKVGPRFHLRRDPDTYAQASGSPYAK